MFNSSGYKTQYYINYQDTPLVNCVNSQLLINMNKLLFVKILRDVSFFILLILEVLIPAYLKIGISIFLLYKKDPYYPIFFVSPKKR